MFASDQYQLIDFGRGRRLERFAAFTLDRPAPAVEHVARATPAAWREVDARFARNAPLRKGTSADSQPGRWSVEGALPRTWTVTHGPIVLELKPTPVGHLGVFPEQAENWDWLNERISMTDRTVKVLNLFAYTGGSTLAASAAGAEVVHLDAARNTVAWARRNAELSGMSDRPIRWIAEDAMKFAKRELKRGNTYDAVILDPPSYGHGAHGEVWRLSKHLPPLLDLCGRLTAQHRQFMLLTCHTPGFDAARLRTMLTNALAEVDGDRATGTCTAGQSSILAATGEAMPSGVVVRWERL